MEEDLFMVLCLSTKNDLVMEVGILVGEDLGMVCGVLIRRAQSRDYF